jgi:hypothetical protein
MDPIDAFVRWGKTAVSRGILEIFGWLFIRVE